MKTTRNAIGKVFNAIFNRMTLTILAFAVQIVYFLVIFARFTEQSIYIEIGMHLLAVALLVYIIWKEGNPEYKISWVLVVTVLPVLGAILYLLFGNKRPARLLRKKMEPVEQLHKADMQQERDPLESESSGRLGRTMRYVRDTGVFPAWENTSTEYYDLGEKMFDAIIEDIKNARKFIFMEYFIVSKGTLWEEIFEILKQKVKEGVEVRITYDDVGSMGSLPKHFVHSLRTAGIEVMPFNTMKPILLLVYNNRDHRKITVVDGNIGYTGGANLADEYANRIQRFGHWKDCGIRLEGPGVWNMTVMFLNMWNSFKPTDDSYDKFRPDAIPEGGTAGNGLVQPFSDTPLDDEALSENVYLDIINQAEDYVYIFTPYLIPSSEMETVLKLAAKRGVDVRLVTPGIPDKPLIFAITRSYYAPLMKAGVKIYEYTPGFIHAKNFVCDDLIAVIGTINVDYRSLFLHFECGTLLVNNSSIIDARNDALDTFEKCHLVTEEDMKQGLAKNVMAAVLRVFSPLL